MIGLAFTIVIPLLLVWFILDWREKRRVLAGLPRHSIVRLFLAAAAILTTLFTGGCGAFFTFSWIMDGMRSGSYAGWEVIAILSLPPFIIGIFVWWLSMRRGNG
jgi:hypothetical protein